LTLIGAAHIGQLKQFLVHLQIIHQSSFQSSTGTMIGMKWYDSYLPAAFALHGTAWNFKEAVRAIPARNFLDCTLGASN
jgi:hypothetical protein